MNTVLQRKKHFPLPQPPSFNTEAHKLAPVLKLEVGKRERLRPSAKHYSFNPLYTTVEREGFSIKQKTAPVIPFEQRQWFEQQTSVCG